jgi:uncharacterized coiled-coil protein SlyX
MASSRQTVLWVVIAVLAVAAAGLFYNYQKTANELATVRTSEQDVQTRYGHTIQAIAEIQDSLDALDDASGFGSGPAATERSQAGPNREAALDRIATLRASIERNKARINELEENLKKSGGQISGLQKLITNLKRSVAEKEEQVAYLTTRVDSLQTEVTGLNTVVAQTQDTLRTRDLQVEDKRRELATIYYVVGDKDQLSKSGIIRSSGGVLGLGKTVIPAGSLDHAAFTPLDTDRETVIRIPAAKARLVSSQPASSYELRPVGEQMELHILNPDEFRKIREVIILTS